MKFLSAVGQLAAQCAFHRGAAKVAIIDNVQYRLDHAKKHMPDLVTINFDKQDVYEVGAGILVVACLLG